MRVEWTELWPQVAGLMALRSTCNRAQVGCVLVDRNNKIVSTGYNGAPHGQPHCLDVGCLMYEGHCRRTVHAEVNALLQADYHRLQGGVAYVTHEPCIICTSILKQAGMAASWKKPYG